MKITHVAILNAGKAMSIQTRFDKALFHNDSEYLMYGFCGMRDGVFVNERQFVARFKYNKRDRAGFKSFLIKNFTVEEYFAARDAGESPAKTLETKGYVSKTVAEVVSAAGYHPNRAGVEAYLMAQVMKTHNTARAALVARTQNTDSAERTVAYTELVAFDAKWAEYFSSKESN
jgi:hypothetical protein